MHCMAVRHFAPSSSLSIFSSTNINNHFFGREIFTPKTSNITTKKSRSRPNCNPIQCSLAKSPSSDTSTIVRRSANYDPPIWSFDFIQSLPCKYKGEPYTSRSNKLKEEVKKMLVGMENSLVQLELIDTLQRLGISYHFENEIISILKEYFTNISTNKNPKYDLYATALEFRLLREYGYAIPQEIFNDFKDETGKFKASIKNDDIKGVLALYEASFYVKNGENILEEARVFTTEYLKRYVMMIDQNIILNDNMAILVRHALEMPLHWRTIRAEAKWFIEEYEKTQDKNGTLLEFAKLDFNMLQSIFQEDLKHVSRWWEHSELGKNKMVYARDRLVEAFLWQVGVRFEPQFSHFRRISARIYALITIIDDIYDVYGTLEELELFTKAVERWDAKTIHELPDYMKLPFFTLFNTVNEMAYDVLEEHNFVTVEYLKNSWAELCRCYLEEAKWFYSGYKPTLKKYIENASLSIGGQIIFVYAFFSLTKSITNEALESLQEGHHAACRQGSLMLRLADDLGTLSDEMKRGDVPKSIQCYMHDTGASEDEAREHIKFLISEIWKEMNDEDEYNSIFSKEFVQACKNLGRMSLFMYQHGDGHASQDSHSRKRISDLIINPIPL
uniref:(+)-alpha-pinene synthase TPS2, chloroplastic n=1 Tax=Cannabis sativa TaxID=3483 RepID=TPS2_CANSA|nr:RecName: Full=(+)-alpha-pinene synthase, chloroplastic; Flags: Precursor [Cannabis sativa]ABI21838.1 (+)-alpha-pinene synthase [Cannabis sativa]